MSTTASISMQCPEFPMTPAVFISGTSSTEVNKGMLLSEVRVATVCKCMSKVKGVWVEGELYHLGKYVYGVGKSKSLFGSYVPVFNL